ncbi:MAG: 3-hydroxyacyl-CoA dehydrogenase family protein [Myxococcota bacterium]|nr:3-hydroxyacyl-CoA dehydrogenase family protein [Myxococcota bacterium]
MRALVVGGGTMGAGIAQALAQGGLEVILVDVDAGALDRARTSIHSSLDRLAVRRRLKEPMTAILGRIATAEDRGDPLPFQEPPALAIESVPENEDLKRAVLARIEEAVPTDALIASNTSSIPITDLAAALTHPGRFVGLHFFNPVVMMTAVEVIAGERSAPDAVEQAVSLVGRLRKDPVVVRRDVPGFVLNRILMAASNEAMRLVGDGVVSAEDVDRGVKGAFGWKMGPLETADLVGLDVVLAAREQIHRRTGDLRFEPPSLLRELVEAGHLGRKTGRGFFAHGEE